jgi:hypothetical protein
MLSSSTLSVCVTVIRDKLSLNKLILSITGLELISKFVCLQSWPSFFAVILIELFDLIHC